MKGEIGDQQPVRLIHVVDEDTQPDSEILFWC